MTTIPPNRAARRHPPAPGPLAALGVSAAQAAASLDPFIEQLSEMARLFAKAKADRLTPETGDES